MNPNLDDDSDAPDPEDIKNRIINNQPIPDAPTPKDGSINDYFTKSKQDFEDSGNKGVTQDDLNALHKHEAANTWTSLFMNMIGAANGIKDGSKYAEPLNKQTEQERQGLGLKQQIANNLQNRALQEQKLGAENIKTSNALRQQNLAQQPISLIQKGVGISFNKKYGLGLDNSGFDNMTQEQWDANIKPVIDLANTGVKEDQIRAMLLRNPLNTPTLKQDATGNWIPVYKNQGTNWGNQQSQAPNEAPNQTLNYNQISSGSAKDVLTPKEIQIVSKQLPEIQKDYQKNYGVADTQFNDANNTVNQLLTESQNGNYKAANSLALQMPRILGGMGKQRITNQEINLENDPTSSGLYNQLVRKVQGVMGEGKVTPQDAMFMKQSMDALKEQHDKMLNSIQDQYRTKAQSLVSKPFKDDQFLFGSTTPINNSNNNVTKTTWNSFDDYKNSLQNGVK